MALRHAVMAALAAGESSGYELSKRFDHSVANFWPASRQQIYRELDRLEADGLAVARRVRQEKRPDKRVFSLTAAGHEAIDEFVRAETAPTMVRDDLLVKVAGLDEDNRADVAAAVRDRLGHHQAKLDAYVELRDGSLGGLSEEEFLAGGPGQPGFGPYLTLMRGIAFERESVRWARRVLALLE
ncbi:MAG: PadR family transcriptional regulator [Solirubrobacterales bacterium]